jgi:hypothetical protein
LNYNVLGIANRNRNVIYGHVRLEAPSYLTPDEGMRNEDKAFRMELEREGRKHCEIKAKHIVTSERLKKAGYVLIK